jgi:hypothetical protein
VIDCSELTTDEQLALAEHITAGMNGAALALARGKDIVLDQLGKENLDLEEVEKVVRDFLARRKDAQYYSVELKDDRIIVHSADPVKAMSERKKPGLPGNLFKCPFCGFVTPYEEMYVVHYRSHGFV